MPTNDWLRDEVAQWVRDGIINENQSRSILSRYEKGRIPRVESKSAEEEKTSKVVSAISIVGVILIGLGVILFVASNWQAMPSALKLLLLFGSTFAAYYSGWLLRVERKTHSKVGQALILLGSLLVGATIFLTAQMFNVEANADILLLLWFIAVSPITYLLDSKPNLVLSLLVFTAWLISYTDIEHGINLLGYGLYGLTLYGIGYLHDRTKYSHFKTSYQSLGIIFTMFVFYSMILTHLYPLGDFKIFWLDYLFLLSAILTVILSAIQFGRGIGKKNEFAWNATALVGMIGFWLIAPTIHNLDRSLYYIQDTDSIKLFLVVYHIIFFVLTLTTLLSGYYQGITSFINIGTFFLFVQLLHLYFSEIFDFLPKSLSLIITGIILLVGGLYLEKKRRSIIREVRGRQVG